MGKKALYPQRVSQKIPKNRKKFVRSKPIKDARPLILIVCEGNETEPKYFEFLKKIWRLSSITIEGKICGSDPLSVVDCAIDLRDSAINTPEEIPYDEVWAVFDKNGHTTLMPALNKAAGNRVNVALSNPCFEYWYLLHFVLSGQPHHNCNGVIRQLKQHYSDYKKTDTVIYSLLSPKTDVAIQNAESIIVQRWSTAQNLAQCNPSTHVHRLVQRLKIISAQ